MNERYIYGDKSNPQINCKSQILVLPLLCVRFLTLGIHYTYYHDTLCIGNNRKGVIKLLLHFYLRVLKTLPGSPHYAKIVISKSTSAHVFLTISMSNYRPPNITVSVNFREYHNNDR